MKKQAKITKPKVKRNRPQPHQKANRKARSRKTWLQHLRKIELRRARIRAAKRRLELMENSSYSFGEDQA